MPMGLCVRQAVTASHHSPCASPTLVVTQEVSKLCYCPCSFRETKGGDFGVVHPAPLMKGLLSEDAACEDLASVLNMVRRASLVWSSSTAQRQPARGPIVMRLDVGLRAQHVM